MVGNIETKPIKKRTTNVLKSYRSLRDFKSLSARPALTVIYVDGIMPISVAIRKM